MSLEKIEYTDLSYVIYRNLLDVSRVGIVVQSFHDREEEQRSLIDHTLLANKLLYGEPKDGDHGKASILDLCKLHALLTRFVGWVAQSKTEVSRDSLLALHPQAAQDFDDGGKTDGSGPICGRDFAQSSVQQGRDTVGAVQQGVHAQRRGYLLVEQLAQRPPRSG
ncbi:hypothetical protein ACHAW5_005645 [Stephanodiscus triporus]|uniref:Uncharacterized protein n=1 Tax=Stephanodiscus triporus TaxID=2934178 RepID=A0ABD3N2Z6_9STRA